MKRFFYRIEEGRTPRDGSGTPKTIYMYQIQRDGVFFRGLKTETFVSSFQLAMMFLEESKLLPRKAFKRSPVHSGYEYGSAWALKQAGIADITEIS